MNKTVIRWKPVALEDPSDRSKTIYVPTIVERNQTKTLSDVTVKAEEFDIHAPGERYAFMFEKTVEIDGKTATVQSNKVYATSV